MPRLWRTWRERRNDTAADAALRERQLRLDYRRVFATEEGGRVLADILARAGVMQSSYTIGDSHETAFREGRRRLGLELVEMINSDPEALTKLATTGETEEVTRG